MRAPAEPSVGLCGQTVRDRSRETRHTRTARRWDRPTDDDDDDDDDAPARAPRRMRRGSARARACAASSTRRAGARRDDARALRRAARCERRVGGRRRREGRATRADATRAAELATDATLGMLCYALSDEIAQRLGTRTHATESAEADACALPTATTNGRFVRDGARIARYVAFGAMDGATSYEWYEWVDRVVPDDATRSDATTTAMKVAMDAVIYNPMWGAFFIVSMGVLSAKDAETIASDVKRDWKELIVSNLTFWVPMNFIIYGFTPLNFRVQVLYALNIIYVCSLSMYSERKKLLKDSGDTMSIPDVVARVLPDDVRGDWRALTGCPSCGGERFVPCPACESGRDITTVVDVNGRTRTLSVDSCAGCQGARRIACPECTNVGAGRAPLQSEDEFTPTY